MTNPNEQLDAESRRRISTELDRNFMVEAAAGTGKTTSIVDRMVNLVASGACEIGQLAAVTFTRKAAAELRERFQAELRRRALEAFSSNEEHDDEANRLYVRLQSASDQAGRAQVGTIHSFCAALLRERPIEFGVDPTFRELEEDEDALLREQAWYANIDDLFASADPLIDQIDELGLHRNDLKSCFDQFIGYRDVTDWPCTSPSEIDVDEIQRQTRDYIDDMKQLLPLFPVQRGNDKLMACYEEIVRGSGKDWSRTGNFFKLLEKFDHDRKAVQKQWHDKKIAKQEYDRFKDFRELVVKPAMQWWCRKRYEFVVRFVRRAVDVYERQKAAAGGLDFTDLLLGVAGGLRGQPKLREYFQGRFTHLLVDEFQDTDPIQAEMILYLTSENTDETDWQQCRPRPGSLFLVGDPKQSIYRFRRGDIVTYNRVKKIFQESGGDILSLVKNFRSRDELRVWNNRVYQEKFLSVADNYTTAAEDMVQGRLDAIDAGRDDNLGGPLIGVHKLTLSAGTIGEKTALEAEAIARFIRHAIDSGMTVPRTEREVQLGCGPAAEPRDFLIIPYGKKRIDLFSEALDRHHLPCEVTGGNALQSIGQLKVLLDCLRAIDDPHNAVHYLAILRDRLFALSDVELYEFKRAGGRFSFTARLPDDLEPDLRERFAGVNARLQQYQGWLRALPFSVAGSRIAGDLGLLASAGAEREGNITLGGYLKALEVLRQQSYDFDSASDLIGYLEQLEEMKEIDGCTALSPDPNVVRVMNLHKAKGLEAPVVFLSDTSGRYSRLPDCHIDRSGAAAAGYMGITVEKNQWGAIKEIATPERWSDRQREEQRFLDAEDDRLLYVATTRAASMLVISIGNDNSNWSGLHKDLEDAPELAIPTSLATDSARPLGEVGLSGPLDEARDKPAECLRDSDNNASPGASPTQKWTVATQPSYTIESAKAAALHGTTRPDWQATGEYGYQWGSAVHELLEIASKTPQADLRPSALMLAGQYDLGTERVDELLATVQAVRESEIWNRAQASPRCFSELPFETLQADGDKPKIIRGVIDLIFEDPTTPNHWIIVDYKTDDISEADIESAVGYYGPQLTEYAQQWQETTGDQVSETGLYFTRIDRYQQVS